MNAVLGRICVLISEVPLWWILEAYFWIFCLGYPETKPIFVGITYRPPKNINFFECFNKHLDDINRDNEVFLLGLFNISLLHNNKYVLEEYQAMQKWIPSTSLLSQYKVFCQRYSLEHIIKHATRSTCSSSTLIDQILTNSRKKISQSSVVDIDISEKPRDQFFLCNFCKRYN